MFRDDDSHSEASSSSEYVSCNDDRVPHSSLSQHGPTVTEVPNADDMDVDDSSSAEIDTRMNDKFSHAVHSFDVESNADDESEPSYVLAQKRNRHHGSALGSERHLLADRRSWVWRRCRGATLAVVVPSAPESRSAQPRRAHDPLPASKQNAIVGKQWIDTRGGRRHLKGCSRGAVQESKYPYSHRTVAMLLWGRSCLLDLTC